MATLKLTGRTVAVTGATGFVGSHIALALQEAGANVLGLVRSPEKGRWLVERGITLKAADVEQTEVLKEALAGVDTVVSNAALGSWQGTLLDFEKINCQGVKNLLQAMETNDIKRLIHISSGSVYRTRICRLMDESSRFYDTSQRRFNWSDFTTDWRYALTKTKAESIIWEQSYRKDLKVTALRPGPVYGSRDPKLTARYLKAMDKSILVAPTLRVPHIHAGDIGQAVVATILNPHSVGKAYNLASEPVSIYRLLKTLRQLLGKGPILLPLWMPLWIAYDCTAAIRDLGFKNRSLEAGLKECLEERRIRTQG